MTVQITLGAAAGICSVGGALFAALAWYIRVIVREELSELDKVYIRKEVLEAKTREFDQRFDTLEKHVAWRS